MMDISDGLSTDLGRLCAASEVGAKIEARNLPLVTIPKSLSGKAGKLDSFQTALHGGDDYGLLVAIPRRRANRLQRAPDRSSLTCIGEITRGRKILLVNENGTATRLEPHGWDPFRRK
jgi:thiamine-monophosphate kinase